MKKMTCGHLLSASLVKKIIAEKDINFHDMTLFMSCALKDIKR